MPEVENKRPSTFLTCVVPIIVATIAFCGTIAAAIIAKIPIPAIVSPTPETIIVSEAAPSIITDAEQAPPPSSSAELDSSISTEPIQFVRDYFSLLNDRRCQEAWAQLSDNFKKKHTYDDYVGFWNTVDKVEISLIEIRSQSDSEVYVYTEILYYYKAGYTTTSHTTYKLVRTSPMAQWKFEPN